jgi:hypothetical protein
MKRPSKTSAKPATGLAGASIAICFVLGLQTATGQQPPDVIQSDSSQNIAMGPGVLLHLSGGTFNTAAGYIAMQTNTSGGLNTAFGAEALYYNSVGFNNTAVGAFSMINNYSGTNNTAVGYNALNENGYGSFNTAVGAQALELAVNGNNTGVGYQSGFNTGGADNTSVGYQSLFSNTYGNGDTASGSGALYSNVTGNLNSAVGYHALYSVTSGPNNTAVGAGALQANTVGGNNIALGPYAGSNIAQGWRNIDIGNSGVASDDGTIRIGNSSQHSAAFIAGIGSAHVTGSAVYISSSGQLGVLASSERYKTAIAPMGQSTEKLQTLRPVTFHLKSEPNGPVQYGLIAEEVARVYPELVIRDGLGKIQGVRYEELVPMLLNEAQQQRQEIDQLKKELRQLQVAVSKARVTDELVAKR